MHNGDPKEIATGITVDHDVCFGKPVVKGTRVPIAVLLEQLSLGAPVDQVAKDYGVTRDDVLRVVRYAYEVVTSETVRAI